MTVATPPAAAPEAEAYRAPRTDPLALAAMLCAAIGTIIMPVLGPIVGAVLGHVALARIRRTGAGGRDMALWAVILGWLSAAVSIVAVVVIGAEMIDLILRVAEDLQ